MSKKSKIFLLSVIGIFVLASASLSVAARLPAVGSDNDAWGTVLNDYLNSMNNSINSVNNSLTTLNNSFGQFSTSLGTLAFLGTVTTDQITDGTITNDDLAGSIAAAKLVGTDITSLPNLATVGTIATGIWQGTTIAVANGGTGATSAADARTNLGLAIGTNVLAPNGDGSILTGLTKAQVGLGSVDNVQQLPLAGGTLTGNLNIGTGLGDLGNGVPNLEVAGQAVFTRDGATSFRLRGKDFSGNNVESYAGVFYANNYDQTGGTGAKKTRVIFGSNENIDLELQGSNHIRITAVDNNVGTGRIRLAAEDEVQVHAGVTAAETDKLVATFTGNGLDVNGEIRVINNGSTSFRLRGACDDTSYSGDDGTFSSTCQSYAGVFNNAVFGNTGGTGARTTRVIYGSNEGMDMELQGSNHIRITAVDDIGGTGRIRLAAEDEIQFHVYSDGTGNAETDAAKYIKFDTLGGAPGADPTIETNAGNLVLDPADRVNIRDVLKLEPRASAPSSASQGDIYVDSDGAALCFYTGLAWEAVGSGTCV